MEKAGVDRQKVTAWPKVLGLEQILKDMDLRRRTSWPKVATRDAGKFLDKAGFIVCS